MATATALVPQSVEADLFTGGGEIVLERSAEETRDGEMLPKQELLRSDRESGVSVGLLISVPLGPLQSMPTARPSRVYFGGLNDPQYRIIKPIALDVSVEESTVVVSWAEVEEFGTGETLSSAIADFAHALRELYRYLLKNEELGPDLASVKCLLGEYIGERPR